MFEKASEKVLTDNEVDIDLTLRAANKVTDFLDENLEKPFERYMVARLVSILYEETKDYSLEPEFESRLRQLARKNLRNQVETNLLLSSNFNL